jgi:hypothetical protein
MTYSVSDEEKKSAEKALIFFKNSLRLLNLSKNYLNLMKTPFKDEKVPSSEIMAHRAMIRRFRDESVKNFNEFKKASFMCVVTMNRFSSDTVIVKLTKSFVSTIDELESKVNSFVDLFDDLNNEEFSTKIVEQIEKIQNECEDLEKIIQERLVPHVQKNILSKNWVDQIGENIDFKIQERKPLILDLFNKSQDNKEKIKE